MDTTTTTVTIVDAETGRRSRVTLPSPHWDGRVEISTGYWLDALYVGPRSGRKFARIHSQWVGSYGSSYCELDTDTYLRYCKLAGCEPVGVAAEEV